MTPSARGKNSLIRKLSSFVDLLPDERQAIERWCATPIAYPARKTFIREGDRPDDVCVLLSGWGYRYTDLRNGKRQIVGFLLPGDLGDARAFLLRAADHSLAMLEDATIASVSREEFLQTVQDYPRLAEAIWWSALVDEGISRHWLVNIGQRGALTRMAHLFCELRMRADAVGLVKDDRFHLPLRQQDLAEALGLTPVHVNRTLKILRQEGLASLQAKRLWLPDFERLKKFAGFNGRYLQLERRVDV